MIKFYRARSLLYRRQILQENIRWKALEEIYTMYMCFAPLRPQYFSKFVSIVFHFFFFRAQAVEEALRKDRGCPVEKETPKRRGASGHKEAQPPSTGCGIVVELAVLKFTRVGRNEIENFKKFRESAKEVVK